MSDISKYEAQKKKLEGLCEEHKFTFSLTQSKGKLSKNEHGEVIDSANAYDYRFNFTPFHITWPKLENTQGAENWSGHTFGGGFFLHHCCVPH